MLSLFLNCDSPVLPWQRRLAVQADEPAAAAGTANASNLKKNAKYAQSLLFSFFFFFPLPFLVLDLSDFFIFGFPMH